MESKKTNLKEKSKFFEKYSTGYNIIRDVVILVSIFFVFYYQDCFYSVYNLSLNELDFNLKYLIYKATIGLITYGFIFTIYLYSVENLSNSNGKKDFWKSFILFFFSFMGVSILCYLYCLFCEIMEIHNFIGIDFGFYIFYMFFSCKFSIFINKKKT